MNADAGNEVTANTEEQPAANNAVSPEGGSGRESGDNAQNEGPLETQAGDDEQKADSAEVD
jgi:hypothetical protein